MALPGTFCGLLSRWLLITSALSLFSEVAAQPSLCTSVNASRQAKALTEIYQSTNGQAWRNSTGWLSSSICRAPAAKNETIGARLPPECCWYGVVCCVSSSPTGLMPLQVCAARGAVSALILPYNNLTGLFPNSALSDLGCALHRVSVHHNNLAGPLTDDLSTLTSLATLQIDYNGLTGVLPSAISRMVSLQALSASHNNFTGTAAPCGPNSALLDVSLSYNSIGTLNLLSCPNLVSFDATANRFDLGRGLQVGVGSSMHIARISHAGLRFMLPEVLIDFFPPLTILELAGSRLYGSLPVSFSEAYALVTLDLSDNPELKGTLPPQYSKLDSLATLDLSGTNLSGTIPDAWSSFFDLSRIISVSLRSMSRLSCCGVYDSTKGLMVYNYSRPRLPSFLKFTDTLQPVVTSDGRYIRHTWCPSVLPTSYDPDGLGPQTVRFDLDPRYYMFEGCVCETGYTGKYVKADPLRVFLTCEPEVHVDNGLSDWQLALIIALPIVGVIVIGLFLAVYLMKRLRTHRHLTWFGSVLPPDAVKGTTILITDMESSTLLWECLPAQVMNEVLLLHDATVRRCLLNHQGYESATAGDSFVLAFHDAMSAVRFAAECQSELLACAWPPELLALPSAAPMYLSPVVLGAEGTPALRGRRSDAGYTSTFHPHSASWRTSRQTSGAHSDMLTAQADEPMEMTWQEPDTVDEDIERSTAGAGFTTVRAYLSGVWQPLKRNSATGSTLLHSNVDKDEAVLVNAGVRVRIGMSTCTGLDLEIITNRTSGRIEYGGPCTAAAAAVEVAATGGMVLLAETTFFQLNGDELLLHDVLVAHMGEHVLAADEEPQNIYSAMLRMLLPRCTLLGPVRSVRLVSASFLDAPFCQVTICFMNIAGIASLTAWNQELAQQCLGIYERVLQDELYKYNGYLVEAGNGLFLTAFPDTATADALKWALGSIKACLHAAWPYDLLQHELGEVVAVTRFLDNVAPAPMRSAPSAADMLNSVKILFRGLRIKCGIDTGDVVADVHAVQGRVTYRGRVMNRAARICSASKSGQVWCSLSAWIKSGQDGCPAASRTATLRGGTEQPGMRGIPLGLFDLKGIGEMEIVHCVTEDGREMLVNGEDGVVICSYSSSFNAKH